MAVIELGYAVCGETTFDLWDIDGDGEMDSVTLDDGVLECPHTDGYNNLIEVSSDEMRSVLSNVSVRFNLSSGAAYDELTKIYDRDGRWINIEQPRLIAGDYEPRVIGLSTHIRILDGGLVTFNMKVQADWPESAGSFPVDEWLDCGHERIYGSGVCRGDFIPDFPPRQTGNINGMVIYH